MEIKKDKPLKRDENLVIFSHEHYHGLLFCTRLKKAENTTDKILKQYILDFWEKYLIPHFENEEKLFLPLFDKKKNEEIKTQFLSEHQQLKTMIKEISNFDIHQFSTQFSTILNNHIRFEERKMFPWLQKNLLKEELKSIGIALENTVIKAHQFTPKFWENEN